MGSILYVTEIFKYTGPLIVLQSENTLQSLIKFTVKPIKLICKVRRNISFNKRYDTSKTIS